MEQGFNPRLEQNSTVHFPHANDTNEEEEILNFKRDKYSRGKLVMKTQLGRSFELFISEK